MDLAEPTLVWFLEFKSKNFCIVLSSPSGAGKTSISKKLLQKDKKLALSISCTTRPRRKGEKNKKDYIFISDVEFKKLKNCEFKKNIKDTCKDSDLIILLTEWDEFKSLDFKKLNKKKNFKVYDLRNLYNPEEMLNKKIEYFSVGRPNTN